MAAQESCIQINSNSLLFLLPPCLAQQFIWVRLLGVLARNDVISRCVPPVVLWCCQLELVL